MPSVQSSDLLERFLLSDEVRDNCQLMLAAIFSSAEQASFNQRLKILAKLSAGNTQRSVAKELGVGVATVTRGAMVLKNNRAVREYFSQFNRPSTPTDPPP